jgi:hypothetical protein
MIEFYSELDFEYLCYLCNPWQPVFHSPQADVIGDLYSSKKAQPGLVSS